MYEAKPGCCWRFRMRFPLYMKSLLSWLRAVWYPSADTWTTCVVLFDRFSRLLALSDFEPHRTLPADCSSVNAVASVTVIDDRKKSFDEAKA